MTIGIDIDDTMTNTSELIMVYAKEYFKSNDIELINKILHSSKIEGELLNFYYKYLPIMMKKYILKDNVKEVIDRLREKGHKIKVDNIIFKTMDKSLVCLKNEVDIMIDDSITVLEKLRTSNIKTLLFTSVSNNNIECEFDRVNTWLELETFIENLYSGN